MNKPLNYKHSGSQCTNANNSHKITCLAGQWIKFNTNKMVDKEADTTTEVLDHTLTPADTDTVCVSVHLSSKLATMSTPHRVIEQGHYISKLHRSPHLYHKGHSQHTHQNRTHGPLGRGRGLAEEPIHTLASVMPH